MKRLVFLSLSLLTLLILIPGCITVQAPASQNTPPSGTSSIIGTFSSNPSTINSGGVSTLMWDVTGANTVSIDHGIGVVNASGTRAISPSASTIYTISATNSSGTVTSTTVTTVNAPISGPVNNSNAINDGATRTPAVITYFTGSLNSDGTSTLSWNVIGADMVSIDQYVGVVNASGTKIVPATAAVYTLTATWAKGNSTNDIGSVNSSVTTSTNASGTPWSN